MALLLAVVLPLLPRRHRFANLFLSGLLACVGGWLLLIATTSNQFQLGNQTLYLGISLSYLMGPFLLCYVQATLQPEFRLHSRMLGYPMPMIMAMAISYPVLLELASDQSILFTHQGSAGLRFVMGMGLMGFVSLTIFSLRVIQISRRAYPKLPESGSLRWR